MIFYCNTQLLQSRKIRLHTLHAYFRSKEGDLLKLNRFWYLMDTHPSRPQTSALNGSDLRRDRAEPHPSPLVADCFVPAQATTVPLSHKHTHTARGTLQQKRTPQVTCFSWCASIQIPTARFQHSLPGLCIVCSSSSLRAATQSPTSMKIVGYFCFCAFFFTIEDMYKR